jgi:hypothetical protein
MFVCRSDIVLMEGLRSGTPKIAAVYDCTGRKKE